jgi:hypothetical protein
MLRRHRFPEPHPSDHCQIHRTPRSSEQYRYQGIGAHPQSVIERRENNHLLACSARGVAVPSNRETQVPRRSVVPADSQTSAQKLGRRGPWIASVVVTVTVLSAGVWLAPSALADSVANFKMALASARSGTSCGPLRDNSVVEQVAETINQLSDNYINHNATQAPIEDPQVGLKDLGYGGNKGKQFQGAAVSDGDAIKGALLEAYAAIPDCSYTDFGVSLRRNESSGYHLTVLVLAGP